MLRSCSSSSSSASLPPHRDHNTRDEVPTGTRFPVRDPFRRGFRVGDDQSIGLQSDDLRIRQLHGYRVPRVRYDEGGGAPGPRERRRGTPLPPAHPPRGCRVARSMDHMDGTSCRLDPMASSSMGRYRHRRHRRAAARCVDRSVGDRSYPSGLTVYEAASSTSTRTVPGASAARYSATTRPSTYRSAIRRAAESSKSLRCSATS